MTLPERIMLGTWGIVMVLALLQLYRWHTDGSTFDLRHFITSPDVQGVEKPDLSKLMLSVALIASTYVIMKDATDVKGAQPELLAVYLGAWVLNKAVSVGGKVYTQAQNKIKTPEQLRAERESNHTY